MIRSVILMNLDNVEQVSTDAIMYLIAIIRNYKVSQKRLFGFYGSYPKNKDAKRVFVESGFLKFVTSNSKSLPSNSEKKSIISGRKSDNATAGMFCEFVRQKLKNENLNTRKLYEAIIEMMSNVITRIKITMK